MTRQQVRDVSNPERIQGVAAPVNTYVRPADPGRSPLNDLAEGLASFDQGLGSFMQKRKAETDEADKAKAITDFHRNNQKGYADAVREGLIPATASKSYVEWYKKQQGHLAGLKLSDKFALDYQQWGGRDTADAAGYSKFASEWVAKNVGDEQDPQVLSGLAAHLDQLTTSGYDAFGRDRDAALKSKSKATSGAILTDTVMRSQEESRAEGSVDYDALWGNLMKQREEAISKGERGEDFDQLIVDSVILQAEEGNSADMLRLLDKKLPGEELPMSRSTEVREKVLRARDRITNKQASQATDLAQTREKLEKQQHEQKLSEAVLALSNGEDVSEDVLKTLERRDGEIRYKLAKYKKEYANLEIDEDPQALMHLYEEIDSGAGTKFVIEMREKGVIKDPATFLKAMDRVKSVQKATSDGGVLTSPTYKDTVKLITNATGTSEFSALDGVKGLSSEGMEALYDYRNMLFDWDMKNPDATILEREKQAKEMGDYIRSRIVETVDPTSETDKEYVSEEEANRRANQPPPVTKAPSQKPQEERGYVGEAIGDIWEWFAGKDAEEEAKTLASPHQPSSTPPALDTVSPARRSAVESLAKSRGISVEEANKVLHEKMEKLNGTKTTSGPDGSFDLNPMNIIRNATSGFRDNVQEFERSVGEPSNGVAAVEGMGVDNTVTNSISSETRTKLSSLLQDPPKVERLTASNVPVAPLLSLIGHTEGTDKRNGYNETLGYGAYTGGDVDLVNMTLGEIDQLQREMLRHPNNTWNSSAIGRYQIVGKTLRGLKKTMGLTDDMKFTPELQDRMAMQLLEGRGLSKWQAGKISDEEFMNGLSAEWASLPKATGRGTYSGQRIGTTTGGVMNAFNQIRGKKGGTEVASLDPSIGLPASDPYANIPEVDGSGNAGQREKFRQWNPDPVGNHEANLNSIDGTLADVVRRAEQLADVKFVVGSGKRDAGMQKKAVEWGWSKTEDSDHIHGDSVDLWPLDQSGAVKFDPAMQQAVVMAMKLAAKELGVDLDIGAEWKSFKDKPHFALKR